MKNKKIIIDFKNSLFILPALILICFVFIYPIFKTIKNSFYETILGSVEAGTSNFVGLKNYLFVFFKDSLFWESIKNNLFLFFVCVPLLVGLSIILSVLLFERIKGWQIYRTIIFTPYVLPIIVVGISFSFMFQYKGIINSILDTLRLDVLKIDWLGRSYPAFGVLIFTIVWKELGFGVIIMLARLLSIDQTLLEAGRLDGCNWWQLLTRIIIPQMKEVIYFYTVLTTIMVFTWLFNYVFVLTRGGPGTSTYILELYIYNQAFIYRTSGVAGAVATILLIIMIIIILIPEFRRITRREEAELK